LEKSRGGGSMVWWRVAFKGGETWPRSLYMREGNTISHLPLAGAQGGGNRGKNGRGEGRGGVYGRTVVKKRLHISHHYLSQNQGGA